MKFKRHSKRTELCTDDISNALRLRNVQVLRCMKLLPLLSLLMAMQLLLGVCACSKHQKGSPLIE